jgi:ethanolamine ammonia-lyase large subunit
VERITRKKFIFQSGIIGASVFLFNGCDFFAPYKKSTCVTAVHINEVYADEDIFSYINRKKDGFDLTLYRQIIGAANEFKEGDLSIGVAATSQESRIRAQTLLLNSKIKDLNENSLFEDDISLLIKTTTQSIPNLQGWTIGNLKQFILEESEETIKTVMPGLSSDIIACIVKVMSNDELISIGQKIFNPLPRSKIGSKGYLSARIQPNSPTDNTEDIIWQVFNGWAFGVGDLVLGTNPVSSDPNFVAQIEKALFDIITTFELQEIIPHCVLSHIDIQSDVEKQQPGTTGIWFQSLAGTVNANQTFDVSIEKMFDHISTRNGPYGLYAETGQGADFTNGHGEGFDMVVHESRKYGFLRALKIRMATSDNPEEQPWVFVNDVAGFIGPEVFRTKEQLVRCCLEDTVMGKLHGLTIGLDICSTLHMDVSLDDLDWCMEQIMPANPAYLMALPTKNDPMLSYLTTSFCDHVRLREQFGFKVNDAMWDFFKKMEIIDSDDKPTEHFGDPIWIYYKYRIAKQDSRPKQQIYKEGRECIGRLKLRGVNIAEGYGQNTWNLKPALENEVRVLYEDAKVSIWKEMDPKFMAKIPSVLPVITNSKDRKDYVYHPETGEVLSRRAAETLRDLRKSWKKKTPEIQIIISDGLNVRALTDTGHLFPFLPNLISSLNHKDYKVSDRNIYLTHGRVRAGYQCGEILFGEQYHSLDRKCIIHIIGERPGSGHRNFSAYLTIVTAGTWGEPGLVDHNTTQVVSGISDTALNPTQAINDILQIIDRGFNA